jgi:hypothetical protein
VLEAPYSNYSKKYSSTDPLYFTVTRIKTANVGWKTATHIKLLHAKFIDIKT